MCNSEPRKLTLTIAILIAFLAITQVRAQTALQVIVGTATVKPTIDGQWHPGEWDNTIEYVLNVTVGSPTPTNIPAYIRMVHDSQNLYGIIDVPSDYGGTYVNANGDIAWGAVLLSFYYGAILNPQNQTQIFSLFALNTNQTGIATIGVYCRCVHGVDANTVSSDSHAATTLSVTPHSSSKHRVWEFSLPIYPYVITTTLDTNPTISFDTTVVDSSGNHISLVNGAAEHADLTFVDASVPDVISGQWTLPVSLVTPMILLAYRRKKLG